MISPIEDQGASLEIPMARNLEIDLVELEGLARKELELELSDKVLDHQNRMLLLYPKVKALMPEGENWMGLLFNVLVVEDPVTEKTAPDLLLVILECMATLLDARREVANFKEITATLQHSSRKQRFTPLTRQQCVSRTRWCPWWEDY